MTKLKTTTTALVLRLLTIVLACAGLYATMFGKDGFMGTSTLYYYTIQSNIWVLLLTLAAVVLALAGVREPRWFKLTRFVIAVAISVTLLVFWALLAPTMPPAYLATVSNLTLHTLVPLLAVFDVLALDRGYVPARRQLFFCAVPPLAYFVFAMLVARLSPTPAFGGARYPYWFLDVDKLGWFSLVNGLGVAYWVAIVVALVVGLGLGLRGGCVRLRRNEDVARATNEEMKTRLHR